MLSLPLAAPEQLPDEPDAAYATFCYWLQSRPRERPRAPEHAELAELAAAHAWAERAREWDWLQSIMHLEPAEHLRTLLQHLLAAATVNALKTTRAELQSEERVIETKDLVKIVEFLTDPGRMPKREELYDTASMSAEELELLQRVTEMLERKKLAK